MISPFILIIYAMKKVFLTILVYLRAVVILCLFVVAGTYLNRWGIPLPATIIGLILLFFSLLFKIIPEHWVAPSCTLLGQYMALLFLPVGVGLMVNYAVVKEALLPLLVACIMSSAMILLLVGFLIERQENNALNKEHKNV